MYCTLQEAYNVPQFVPKRKKSSMDPINPMPNMMQCAPGAEEFDTASQVPQQQQQNPVQAASRYAQQQNQGVASCGNGSYGGGNGSSGSCAQRRSQASFPTNNAPYGGQANDYKYYCDYYNICPDQTPLVEGFNVPLQKTLLSDLQQHQLDVDTHANAQSNGAQCGQIQAPMYTIPVSDAAKKANAAALNTYMGSGSGNNMPTSTLPVPQKPVGGRQVDMTKVAGLYDDDIDQYMNLQSPTPASANGASVALNQSQQATNMNLLPTTQVPASGTITNPAASHAFENTDKTPLAKSMAAFDANLRPVDKDADKQSSKNKETSKWQYVIDLILFIVAGILVIMLCEMLFKIALTIGMRDTINVIEPYLAELQELKLKIQELGRDVSTPVAAP